METGFRFQDWKRKLVSVSMIGNGNWFPFPISETKKWKHVKIILCPDVAKLQDEAALSPPFQIWLSGRPTLLGIASIISSWCWEGREGSTCATIAPPFHNEAALSHHCPHLHPICRPRYCCRLQDPTTPDARYHPIPSSFC